jgi:hypothetical protein
VGIPLPVQYTNCYGIPSSRTISFSGPQGYPNSYLKLVLLL